MGNDTATAQPPFANDTKGHAAPLSWADRHAKGQTLHYCMEATGPYSGAPATRLADAGRLVSVVNPTRIKYAGLAQGYRGELVCPPHPGFPHTPIGTSIPSPARGKRRFMGLLYPSELQDSSEWVLSNAQDILDSVKKAGGWKKLFPNGVPTWLHRLRNYFNVEPTCLRLVPKPVTDHWMRDIRSYGQMDGFIGKRALTGHVYFDEEVEVWYQMSAGGTIYHWGDDVRFEKIEAAYTQKVYTQTGIPVFKLVCPDGTGGSKETILTNPVLEKVKVVGPQGLEWKLRRSSKVGDTNQQVLVKHRVVTRMKHQGSYNFSETAVVGLDDHKKRDVEPHKKDPNYIDPPDRFAPLKDRIFNEFVIVDVGGTAPKKRSP